MTKKLRVILAALVIVVAVTSVVLANGTKGFEPYKVPVDKDNLPEEVSEADLDGDYISAHRLEEIAKEKGEDVVIEGTDGNTYTAKHNMLGHVPTSSLVAVNKEEEKAEGEKAPEGPVENEKNDSLVVVNKEEEKAEGEKAPEEPIKNEENDSLVAVNKEAEKAEGEKEPDEKLEEPSKEDSNTPPEIGNDATPDPGESKNEEASPAPHTHSYEWWYEEVNGLTHTNYYKCSCGDYYTDSWNETPKEESKDSGGSTSNSSSGGQDAGKKEEGNAAPPPKSDPPKNDPPAHEHAWEEVRTAIHHDAVTEKVWVVDKAAYDEQVVVEEAWDEPVYEQSYELVSYWEIGDGTIVYTEAEYDELCIGPNRSIPISLCNYTIITESVPVETVTYIHHDPVYKAVHHDEEGHYEEKVITPAYNEEKVTGYKCSCGATK